jgi:hypothetical protein
LRDIAAKSLDGGKDDAWRRTKTSTHDALHRSRDMIHATHDVTKALPTSCT